MWSALESVWAEGMLEPSGENKIFMPYNIYDLLEKDTDEENGDEDKAFYDTLKIPSPKSLIIEANSSSYVGDPNFRIRVEASHPDLGPLRDGDPARNDRVFILSEDSIVPLTRAQADLFNDASGENTDWNDMNDRMRYLALVKKASQRAGAVTDRYIQDEDYEFVSEAGIDLIEEGPDNIRLIPKIKGIEEFDVDESELFEKEIPSVINKAESGLKRKRAILKVKQN